MFDPKFFEKTVGDPLHVILEWYGPVHRKLFSIL